MSLPRPDQWLLLRAALAPRDAALEAWAAWRQAVNLDEIDRASFRILPLVWLRLDRLGVRDPVLDRLRGVYRQTWTKHQMTLHRTRPALHALAGAGIDLLILKGAALAAMYYPTPGARPMNDVDVLVPEAAAARARAILERAGWQPAVDLPGSALRHLHGLGYRHENGSEIDLHWRALWEAGRTGQDDPLWDEARPLDLAGLRLKTLSPTAHLFQVCVHGLRWSEVPPIHWVADAALIVSHPDTAIDWSRLVALSRREGLTLTMRAALALLRDELALPMSAEAIGRLEAARATVSERIDAWARTRPPAMPRELWLHWRDHRRGSGRGVAGSLAGFPIYLQSRWGLPRLRDVPGATARKVLRRLRGRPSPQRHGAAWRRSSAAVNASDRTS